MALEIAKDEMAEKLGIDPLEFRILNDTQVGPEKLDRPFSAAACCLRASLRGAFRVEQAQPDTGRDPRGTSADRPRARHRFPQQHQDEVRCAGTLQQGKAEVLVSLIDLLHLFLVHPPAVDSYRG
jgi:CO/xanthine dehydrogenase Mo-binding subunit